MPDVGRSFGFPVASVQCLASVGMPEGCRAFGAVSGVGRSFGFPGFGEMSGSGEVPGEVPGCREARSLYRAKTTILLCGLLSKEGSPDRDREL